VTVADPQAPSDHADQAQNIAGTLAEVTERASVLVREEIELAKAEMSEKVAKLLRGVVVAAAAGIFVVMSLIFALIGLAWLVYWLLPVGVFSYFWGFFIVALFLLLLGALAGVLAARAVRASSPPTPKLAIEEARKIRETVTTSTGEGS
jgi:uncharacterized membrane protein YqjE